MAASEERGDVVAERRGEVLPAEECVNTVLEDAHVLLLPPPVADRRTLSFEPGGINPRHVASRDLDPQPVGTTVLPHLVEMPAPAERTRQEHEPALAHR